MSGVGYKIEFDLGSKLDLMAAVNREIFPLVHQAVRAVAKQTAIDWQAAVLKAKLWSVEKDSYAASIKWSMKGDFEAYIESDYKYAQEIETGRPVRDLKRMLDTSQKVRRTKDGRRFLVIPFRHNTPGNDAHAGAMPAGVYGMAKALEASRVVAQGQRPSGHVMHLSPTTGMTPARKQSPFLTSTATKQAATVASRTYAWGGRLTKSAMKEAGMDAATRKRYGGMVKMDTSTPGGAKSSSYLTFRIMIEGSKGWLVPAQPGQLIVKGVTEAMQPKAEAVFAEAVKRTLKG